MTVKAVLSTIALILASQVAIAQQTKLNSDVQEHEISTTQGKIELKEPSKFFTPLLMTGYKSYNDSARPWETGAVNKKEFKSKNEMFLGVKNPLGWGVYGQAVEYINSYTAGSGRLSGANPGDPSVSLVHPIYSSDKVLINGQLREYFPVGDFSQNRGQYQQAYYLNSLFRLKNKVDLFNTLIPRNFVQTYYKGSDTTFFVEDYTTISRKSTPWFRYGFGQHTQIEAHSVDPVGKSVEVYPFADFMISNSVFLGPRLYIPVAAQNAVFEGPTAVSLSNVQAELYIQATL